MRIALAAITLASCGRIGFAPINGNGNGDDGGSGSGDGGIPPGVNIAFVTSSTPTPGLFGGLAGADAICNNLAAAAHLPGTYVAWLSTSSVNAIDRLAGSRGWVRSDGRPFVDTVADLVAGNMFFALGLDENRTWITPDVLITTGTLANGTVAVGATCTDYTSTTGNLAIGEGTTNGLYWTYAGTNALCGSGVQLYCFGIGGNTQVRPPPVTTRRAFLSPAPAAGAAGMGLAYADSVCQAAADANTLGGTFRAMLATTSAPALARFDVAGTNWVRLDGAALATSPMTLGTQVWLTSLDVLADGTHDTTGAIVWTGATEPGTLGMNNSTCMDWSKAQAAATAEVGYSYSAGYAYTGPLSYKSCDSLERFYCFEQ